MISSKGDGSFDRISRSHVPKKTASATNAVGPFRIGHVREGFNVSFQTPEDVTTTAVQQRCLVP
jgi:hypothetical protein